MNRRHFLATVGAAGAGLTAARGLGAEGETGIPAVGLIGCGWYGVRNLQNFMAHARVNVVSLCDVNSQFLADAREKIAAAGAAPELRTFGDFRLMLASRHHDIVLVGTPDHWHALPAIAAMQAGADVYLEKPVSLDVIEGEALVAAARKYGRVVQVNTQRRSTPHLAAARDKYIRSGRIGRVGLVETFSYLTGRIDHFVPDAEPPSHLDYDFWTGPAPMLPFKPIKESRQWRNFTAYGNGQIGDLGVHMFDLARWMLGLGWPQSVHSTGGIYVDTKSCADITDTQQTTFVYPQSEVRWRHQTWGVAPFPIHHWSDGWGIQLLGKEGTLVLTLMGYTFTPADGPADTYRLDPSFSDNPTAEAERLHCLNFLAARRTRSRPIADIAEGHVSTASCVLGNVSRRLGRPVAYDPATRTVPGDAEATALLSRAYRSPWVHPTPENV
ncbi:MAG TPA: Gfo/Idh/MocA family oxidoreductase [Opitutaceae bacterium]|jgi:predicted dehydrogenase